MKKQILMSLIISCLLLVNCNKLSKFEKTLVKDSYIWNFMALEHDKWTFFGSQRKFLRDNTYEFYLSENSNKIGNYTNEMLLDRNNSRNKWLFNEKDSIFSLGFKDLSYKVIRYNQDSIFLEGNGYTGKFLMVRFAPSHQ